ncbi:hypothetical protein FQN57_001513 [Myotisia sp. PD_48]|nr:hypothetical protein FQN57_001513 [Myotisia sp. PD_48]
MAPRRGGGGGGGFGGSSLGNRCSEAGAFTHHYPIVLIAFFGLFLLVTFVLGCLIPGRKNRAALRGLRPAKFQWTAVTFCLLFESLAIIVTIVQIVLGECGFSTLDTLKLYVTSLWFSNFARYLLLGITMLPVCTQLHLASGQVLASVTRIIHMVYLGVVGIVLITPLSILTDYIVRLGNDSFVAVVPLRVTWAVLSALGVIIAGASILIAVGRNPQLRQGTLSAWCFGLLVFLLGAYLCDLATIIRVELLHTPTNPDSILASIFLSEFFFLTALTCAIYLLSNSSLSTTNPAGTQYANDTMPPITQYPPAAYPNQPVPVPQQPAYQQPIYGHNPNFAPQQNMPPAQPYYQQPQPHQPSAQP